MKEMIDECLGGIKYEMIETKYETAIVLDNFNDIDTVLNLLCKNKNLQFSMLIDICGADYPQREERFEVIYHLLSIEKNARLRIKTKIADGQKALSVVDIYSAAGWFEREVFDMFGIEFTGNPDMRRILTDYDFKGHPLRKDFPLNGFEEIKYDIEKENIVSEPVKLGQEYRSFDYEKKS